VATRVIGLSAIVKLFPPGLVKVTGIVVDETPVTVIGTAVDGDEALTEMLPDR
jgi:hypothetical protein